MYRQGWMGENRCNDSEGDSERDESTKEKLQCKKQYLCTPHVTPSLASLSPWPCLCTESMPETTGTNNAIMRYTKSLSSSPTVANSHSSAGTRVVNVMGCHNLHSNESSKRNTNPHFEKYFKSHPFQPKQSYRCHSYFSSRSIYRRKTEQAHSLQGSLSHFE